MKFGSKLKFMQYKKMISTKELSEKMNLEQNRIRTYCSNTRCAKDELRNDFANALSCKSEDLKSYEMQSLEEVIACLHDCIITGGIDFCVNYISSLDRNEISMERLFYLKKHTKKFIMFQMMKLNC